MEFEEESSHFDAAAERMIELGNELLDQDADSDSWEGFGPFGRCCSVLAVCTPALR